MQISLSATSIFDSDKPGKYLKYISDAGFNSMMLDMEIFCSKYMLEEYGDIQKGQKSRERMCENLQRQKEEPEQGKSAEKKQIKPDIQELKQQYAGFTEQVGKTSLHFDVMRAPHLKWDTKRTDLNKLMLQIGKDCIESCLSVGCKTVIIQPLFAGVLKEDIWQENRSYYLELGRIAQENGIRILLENQCKNVNGHPMRGVCADVSVVSEWIDLLNEELGNEVFEFCLDTGVSSLCRQDMGEMAAKLGKRLKAVIVRECDGVSEASRMPFTGLSTAGSHTDWGSLIKGLRRNEFDGLLIMEARDTLRGISVLLRPQLYPVLKSVADFLKWQIEIEKKLKQYSSRVLFGAGKMCSKYMECYGQQYPPLFTCDNNTGLWGKKVSGVEVKPPEALKDLPKDCGVFICNVYYREIAEQLKAMGVKNIEAFNDEYLTLTDSD